MEGAAHARSRSQPGDSEDQEESQRVEAQWRTEGVVGNRLERQRRVRSFRVWEARERSLDISSSAMRSH